MKLLFYSGHCGEESAELDRLAVEMVADLSQRLVFIPADEESAYEEFEWFKSAFSRYGFRSFELLIPGSSSREQAITAAMDAGMIFLGGGNTFRLLGNLRTYGWISVLQNYAYSGGTLAGHSAGAIVMTPSIDMASIPSFDADENHAGLEDWSAMRLVNFEFCPHYINRPKVSRELRIYSRNEGVMVYASPDGSGIGVWGERLIFVGPTWVFHKGIRAALRS